MLNHWACSDTLWPCPAKFSHTEGSEYCTELGLLECLLGRLLSGNHVSGCWLYGYIAVGGNPYDSYELSQCYPERSPYPLLQDYWHHPQEETLSALPSPRGPNQLSSVSWRKGYTAWSLDIQSVYSLEAIVWDQDKALGLLLQAWPSPPLMGDS